MCHARLLIGRLSHTSSRSPSSLRGLAGKATVLWDAGNLWAVSAEWQVTEFQALCLGTHIFLGFRLFIPPSSAESILLPDWAADPIREDSEWVARRRGRVLMTLWREPGMGLHSKTEVDGCRESGGGLGVGSRPTKVTCWGCFLLWEILLWICKSWSSKLYTSSVSWLMRSKLARRLSTQGTRRST